MSKTKPTFLDKIIKDNNGRVVLWQNPNLALWSWIVLKLFGLVLENGRIKSGIEQLATATLFTWAFLEATKGVNYFRRSAGLAVLVAIVWGFFR